MLQPDFADRTYTAEVVRVKTKVDGALRAIRRLTYNSREEVYEREDSDSPVRVFHGFIPSEREYHRVERMITLEKGERIRVPRRLTKNKHVSFLYDVIIAESDGHVLIAVPFHDLGERFFIQADRALAGTGARYRRLDITALVIRLGSGGVFEFRNRHGGDLSLSVTRCHLAFNDPQGRNRNLQQIQMTGANLGATTQYQNLIMPVILPGEKDTFRAVPIVMGFALASDGVRKSSATTDRHGNFKLWISSGLRQVTRLFALLEAIGTIADVAKTTPNVPILQSDTIRAAENK